MDTNNDGDTGIILIVCVPMIVFLWKKKKLSSEMIEKQLESTPFPTSNKKNAKNLQNNTIDFPEGVVNLRSLSNPSHNEHSNDHGVETNRNEQMGETDGNDVGGSDHDHQSVRSAVASKSNDSLLDHDFGIDIDSDENQNHDIRNLWCWFDIGI